MTEDNQFNENLKAEIIDALREVYDPEIPINVYDLGLIYTIEPNNGQVHITMSLTSPTCPTAEYIQEMISSAVSAVQGVKDVEIELTFEPRWTPDRVSEDAREELGLGGADDSKKKAKMDPAITNIFGDNDKDVKKENICVKCMVPDTKVPLLKTTFNSKEKLFCLNCIKTF